MNRAAVFYNEEYDAFLVGEDFGFFAVATAFECDTENAIKMNDVLDFKKPLYEQLDLIYLGEL